MEITARCRIYIHYLNKMRAINDGVKFVSVDLNIIAYIPQFFYHTRIPFGKDIFPVIACLVIKIIERSFITAHIPFVEQKEPFDTSVPYRYPLCYLCPGGRNDGFSELIFPAGTLKE